MKTLSRTRRAATILAASAAVAAFLARDYRAGAQGVTRFPGSVSSGPIELTADGLALVTANPDNDTITVFDVQADRNRKIGEIRVGSEPNGVAVNPTGTRASVANTVSGTVSVIALQRGAVHPGRVIANVRVGTEPYAVLVTPNGRKVFVANSRSNSITIIDANTNAPYKTIENVGFEPRGLAITNDGDDDETLYVTQFLAVPVAGKLDGEDDSKTALVTSIDVGREAVSRTIVLRPMIDSGFKAAGDAIARVAPPAAITEESLRFTTGAYPNQLNSIAIRGSFAIVPNTGASPNGPTRFDVNTQALVNVIDLNRDADTGRTINIHRAVADQTVTPRLFFTQPWAIAAKHRADQALVVSQASNVVMKLNIDPTTGAPTVVRDPSNTGRTLQVAVGKAPRGIAINAGDTRAYVMNYISRDVSVIDLTRNPETVIATIRSAAAPDTGSLDEAIHIGKELYITSVGEFDPAAAGGQAIRGRMSNNGWGSCGSCHPFGLSDNVVWIFAAGPRRTIPQHTDYDLTDPNLQRSFNWSSIFDEQEDFELNIRNVSGGQGLIVGADGIAPDAPVAAFTPVNANRRQLKVRGVNAWDAIKAYIKCGIRAPISPVDKNEPDVV